MDVREKKNEKKKKTHARGTWQKRQDYAADVVFALPIKTELFGV